MLWDALAVALAYQLAALLRFDGIVPEDVVQYLLPSIPVVVAIHLVANFLTGIYWRAWQYADVMDALALGRATVLALAVLLVVDIAIGMPLHKRPVPLSVALAGSAFSLLAMGGIKLAPRIRRRLQIGDKHDQLERLLIMGAGEAGQWLVRELQNSVRHTYLPVCFVDDDPRKINLRVHGVPIVGERDAIPDLVKQLGIDVVAVAMPSAPGPVVRDIVSICQRTDAKVRIVPGVQELLEGHGSHRPLRDVTVEDLLGREPVAIDLDECRAYIAGQTVLLTGAAGSIGSELTRQVLRLQPKRLVLVDTNESGLHDVALHCRLSAADERLALAVCGVDDRAALRRVFHRYRPTVVFHAAGYKHVPLMEQHPDQAVLVNVGGTANVCMAADEYGAQRVVLISTDKAVNPSNVMGATKRLCEELVRAFGRRHLEGVRDRSFTENRPDETDVPRTLYYAVRFGNVLDSRGSVIPTFSWQIDTGGPVTVTHRDMRRYFMTIPEAASLVIQAGVYAESGDIFLLDMGEEMHIADLAEKMILMRGLRPGTDIQIVYTGLRPGEKLREELVIDPASLQSTPHVKINRIATPSLVSLHDVLSGVEELQSLALARDIDQLRTRLFALVREYDRTNTAAHEATAAMAPKATTSTAQRSASGS